MVRSLFLVLSILCFVKNYNPSPDVVEMKSHIVCNGDISLLVWQEITRNGSAYITFSPIGSKQVVRLGGDKNDNAFSPNGVSISDSSFIFVWQGYNKIKGACINAALVEANGRVTQHRRVFDYDGKDRYHPVVVPSLPNKYLVFWQDAQTGNYDIVASSISMGKEKTRSLFIINEDTSKCSQYYPEAAKVSNHILVIWQDRQLGRSAIWGQFLKISGEKEGGNFLLSPGSELDQTRASITSMGDRLAVVWQEARPGTMSIMLRFINQLELCTVIQVSEGNIARARANAQCAFFHDGKLVVVWMDQRDENIHIYAQLFDRDGRHVGDNFEIERLFSIIKKNEVVENLSEDLNKSHLGNDQFLPDIEIDEDGRLFVCWTEVSKDRVCLKLNADSCTWEDWIPKKYHNRIKKRFWLYRPSPSPFEKEVKIKFEMPRSEKVTVTVYDVTGRKVIKLNDDILSEGAYNLKWDGKNEQGREVSAGSYFIFMEAGDFRKTRKVIKIK